MIFGCNRPFEQAIRRHILEQTEVFRRNSDRRGLSVDRAMQAHELRDKKLPAPSRFAEAKIYSSSLEKSIYASSHLGGVSQAKSPRAPIELPVHDDHLVDRQAAGALNARQGIEVVGRWRATLRPLRPRFREI